MFASTWSRLHVKYIPGSGMWRILSINNSAVMMVIAIRANTVWAMSCFFILWCLNYVGRRLAFIAFWPANCFRHRVALEHFHALHFVAPAQPGCNAFCRAFFVPGIVPGHCAYLPAWPFCNIHKTLAFAHLDISKNAQPYGQAGAAEAAPLPMR